MNVLSGLSEAYNIKRGSHGFSNIGRGAARVGRGAS
jgi:hypothetical protein